jgi:acetylornithine deacetylase/succinyl-diaminopimelate desuccinylase-like protein
MQQLNIANRKHDVCAIQVYDRRAMELPKIGLMKVVDAETGYEQYVDTSSRMVRETYRRYWNERQRDLKEVFAKSGVDNISIATDDDYVKPEEWGDIKLGKGGAIAHGVNNNPSFTKMIKEVCREHNIPYQEFVAPSHGTDTLYIKQSSSDCATQLLSIPNRNMHTQVEMCDYRDLKSLIDMTVATIMKINDSIK